MKRSSMALALLVLAGCGGDETEPRERPARPAQPAPPPDAGTAAGHGADPDRVVVPRDDATPPAATIVLSTSQGEQLGEASQPPGRHPTRPAHLNEPRLRGTTTGRDADGGVARVRISIKETITCSPNAGPPFERRRVRYFPPPQVERIRSNPGARLPTEASRNRRLRLAGDRCEGAQPTAVRGELWGEAINGNGLEAVTPHIDFTWSR